MRSPVPLAWLLTIGLIVAFNPGCSKKGSDPVSPSTSPPPPATGTTVSFSRNVKPILDAHGCTNCHGGNGGLFLTTVAQIKQGGQHGPAVIPGNGAGSIIVQKISPNPPFGARMPFGGPYLSDSLQLVIKTWVDEGAQDN